MLRIIQNTSPAGAKKYFSQADYYSEGQELIGEWGGKGAKLLGLEGRVKQRAFDAMCDNLHPLTGEQLTPRTRTARTVAYDFNFSVPKGISVVYALNRDERIIQAVRDSVRETMSELEAAMKTRVRTGGRDSERVTGNLVYAEYVHHTARPVQGIPDPLTHVHAFCFNATFDEQEQRFKAGQFQSIKQDAPYYQAAFYARLAKRLEALHYPIERSGKGWDLAHLPRGLARRFSRRTDEIEKLAAKLGITDPDRKSELGAQSREKKDKQLTMPQLREIWRERLSKAELEQLATIGHRQQVESPSPPLDSPETAAIEHAVEHCFQRSAVVAKTELLAEALKYGLGRVDVDQLKQALADSDVIVRTLNGREMATTKSVLSEERELLTFAGEGKGAVSPLNPDWQIQRPSLNAGQRDAVRHVLSSRDRVAIVEGNAGTGKTTLLLAAAEAIQAAGHKLLALAPSAQASRGVLKEIGFKDATTVAELLVNPKLQAAGRSAVWWIDEAGLLGTRTLKQVFDLADKLDARLVLSGDRKQHGAVERSGELLHLLETEAGIKPARISEIVRQSGDYRKAVKLVADGEIAAGFDQFDRLGWIKEIPDSQERYQQVAREYANSLAKKEDVIVIVPTHAEGDRITQAIRSELKSRELLGRADRLLPRLTSRNLTVAERADSAMIEPGNVLVFTQNAPGYVKGERIVVGDKLPKDLAKLAKRFEVYRADKVPLAVKDAVRITANGRSKDGHRLNNGAVYHVAGFTKSGDVRLDNGWLVDKQYCFITLGHVSTSHASQGRTCEHHVIVAQTANSLASNREQFYVSVSRSKRKLTLFCDDQAGLRESICHGDVRPAATELVRETHNKRRVTWLNRLATRVRSFATRRPHHEPIKQGERSYGR